MTCNCLTMSSQARFSAKPAIEVHAELDFFGGFCFLLFCFFVLFVCECCWSLSYPQQGEWTTASRLGWPQRQQSHGSFILVESRLQSPTRQSVWSKNLHHFVQINSHMHPTLSIIWIISYQIPRKKKVFSNRKVIAQPKQSSVLGHFINYNWNGWWQMDRSITPHIITGKTPCKPTSFILECQPQGMESKQC